jgi:hypothetical protein
LIDSAAETLISFAEAANEVPRRRRGKKCHVSTIHRWAVTGIKGIRLETVVVGGSRCTSREALARFFRRLTEARDGAIPCPAPIVARSEAQRLRDSQRAGKRLEQLGA